jgi:hypothetical protein
MGPGNWLRLTDYASKYRISISTLRRRIKSGELAHRFEEGKYLIFDAVAPESNSSARESAPEPVEAPIQHGYSKSASFDTRGSSQSRLAYSPVANHAMAAAAASAPLVAEAQEKLNQLRAPAGYPQNAPEEPILSSANRLLSELKRAYMNILQEKEEQMIQLKEEVSDLKTLVRVLEDDNDRMRKIIQYPRN